MADISEIFEEERETFERKNGDYGNSWQKTPIIEELLKTEDFNVEEDGDEVVVRFTRSDGEADTSLLAIDGLMTRMLDKMCRIAHLTYNKDEPDVDESLADSLGDLGNYSFMGKSVVINRDS